MTLAAGEFERYGKRTRRAAFLADMERVVPWAELCALIEPVYPKPGNGRPPVGLERMLRIYFLAHWFNLSDPAVEEALYESVSMRSFMGIDLGREPVPDETTVCKFRHLLEQHGLGQRLFEQVGRHLSAQGMKVSGGTIVDATIISAPSSTKNQSGERDPQMHQTKKGNQWYFGMKAHVGVDSKLKLIHSVVATPANAARQPSLGATAARGRDACVGIAPMSDRRKSFAASRPKPVTSPRPRRAAIIRCLRRSARRIETNRRCAPRVSIRF